MADTAATLERPLPPPDLTAEQLQAPRLPAAAPIVYGQLAEGLAPRKVVKVSDWADEHRVLSTKGSAEAGQWSTERNPPTREPMDCFSVGAGVHDVVLMWPIQFAKTEVALNVIGYGMMQNPGPFMVCLPGEVSQIKWVSQKLQPMLDESPAIMRTLTSVSSRESSNTKTFKDFAGGQLYIEHAGSPARLKSTSARLLIVDEFDEFAANFVGGDPAAMLDGRTSAFPGTYQRLYISSPQIKGQSRIEDKWLISDQRRYFVACPHCAHEQFLQWSGLKWEARRHPVHGRRAWYVCAECGAEIEEHHKTEMIRTGRWLATNPDGRIRGYHINCLYYQIGLGPRWSDLVEMWLDAQDDPAKLQTFINDRLAETWEDPSMRRVRHDAIADRAETYALRTAPAGVLAVTAGVDTQDDRLAVHITGWGRGLAFWALDYVELPGDPAGDEVWHALTTLLTTPILHASGATMHIEAYAQDAAGHRTEDVKAYIRSARWRGVRRPLCIFGAVPNNAPVLAKGKMVDVSWRGNFDKAGIQIYHVGTVAAKNWLFGRLSLDAKRDDEHLQALQTEEAAARAAARATKVIEPPLRLCHFSVELPDMYWPGLVSETFDPRKNRYEKRRGARNEPLDTWVYSFAAIHHPELRLHRATEIDWRRRETELLARAPDGAFEVRTPAAAGAGDPGPRNDNPAGPAGSPGEVAARFAVALGIAQAKASQPPAEASAVFAALLKARKGGRNVR
jgi:phage terminase large subunit GpA-like protein